MYHRNIRREARAPLLFRLTDDHVRPIATDPALGERSLQLLVQRHLRRLLGVYGLASEYPTGTAHRGRIDTLGIDDAGVPVIVEYKRVRSANLINQGLFYLDWLQDHHAEFQLLVESHLGPVSPQTIQWETPRLICLAPAFHRYDLHVARQFPGRIELVQYRWFADDLFLLQELVVE